MKRLTKRVQAGGLWFDVDLWCNWVVIDADGSVYSHEYRPEIVSNGYLPDGKAWDIGRVDLEGADWRECCWYVGDQVDGEYVSMAVQIRDEISDFCAGLESPGCPETAEEIQSQLMNRILPLIKDERREWMARGVELYRESPEAGLLSLRSSLEAFANKIRSGEVE